MAEDSAGDIRQVDRAPGEPYEPQPPRWLRPIRDRVRGLPGGVLIWKLVIAALGGVIVVIGVLLIPLPGPGWALVFLGVAVWASEFRWAQRLLHYGRGVLRKWTTWASGQSVFVRLLLGLAGVLLLVGLAYLALRFLR